MENARTVLLRNSKKLMLSAWFSVALGVCFLFLKCTARPASVDVPYSDFVSALKSGSVSAVQFEEDSRYIYFNKINIEDSRVGPKEDNEILKSVEESSLTADVSDVSAPKSSESITNERERGGTGKTLLARSVAGEAGVPFFSVSASEFVELFVGRGAARVRDLFNVAKECAPSIVFIDELDAVGGKRGRSFNDERDQTLNQLLTEMDGFESETKVIVIAATNRPEALDPALCRPGRFSRKVLVGEPDYEGRKKILAVHLRQVPVEEEIELICDLVASLTAGLVGADLANIVNEAALLAARRGLLCCPFKPLLALV
ncbi:hypothetical protein BHE74_00010740 [Ensete ventricosum]|nr:hypothetical protein BHE74_00010740 [Ensete ventricosum]RZR86489.1 hypothetical protein BHM03_00013718 [Ensete ventricosum]